MAKKKNYKNIGKQEELTENELEDVVGGAGKPDPAVMKSILTGKWSAGTNQSHVTQATGPIFEMV